MSDGWPASTPGAQGAVDVGLGAADGDGLAGEGLGRAAVELEPQAVMTRSAATADTCRQCTLKSMGSGHRRRRGRSLLERDLAVVGVDLDDVALRELALQQLHGQRVLHEALDRPLQRARAVDRVPTPLGE